MRQVLVNIYHGKNKESVARMRTHGTMEMVMGKDMNQIEIEVYVVLSSSDTDATGVHCTA